MAKLLLFWRNANFIRCCMVLRHLYSNNCNLSRCSLGNYVRNREIKPKKWLALTNEQRLAVTSNAINKSGVFKR